MLRSASQSLGPMAANLMRSIDLEHLPALVVANKIRSSTEIVSVMHGHLVVNELISNFMQVIIVISSNLQLIMSAAN